MMISDSFLHLQMQFSYCFSNPWRSFDVSQLVWQLASRGVICNPIVRPNDFVKCAGSNTSTVLRAHIVEYLARFTLEMRHSCKLVLLFWFFVGYS